MTPPPPPPPPPPHPSPPPRPPATAVWLLSRRIPAALRDFILGDLEEEFRGRHAVSPADARRWYWRQTVRCLAAPPPAPPAATQHPDIAFSSTLSRHTGDSLMRTLLADVRLALRVFVRTPGFAFAAIGVLALGIGANTAIFSLVNTVLLRPLPFDEPDSIVRVFHVPPQATFPNTPRFPLSPANFYDWQAAAKKFEAMALFRFREFVLTGQGEAATMTAGALGPGFLRIIRVQPALGRDFLPEEDEPGRGRVVILSDRFWRTNLGARTNVIGEQLTLNDMAYTIVGVMPPSFRVRAFGITNRAIYVPLALSAEDRAVRENHNLAAVARLKPGVDAAQATAELEVIARRLEQEYPQENAGWGATVITLRDVIVGDIRLSLLMLLGAVALVLLIACANVGNLLLARALSRRKELAIRAALGAGRGRVFRQLLVEAIVLAGAGGVAGTLLAYALLRTAAVTLAGQIPRADELTIDTTVLLFVVAVSVVTGVLAGALPALRAGRSDLNNALREGGRHDGVVGLRTRHALVVCEVALSVVLLMGAAVMLRSLMALATVDAGFNADNVLTMRVSLPERRFPEPARVRAYFDEAMRRLKALPGVQAAGAIDNLPLFGGSVQPVVLEGRAELLPRDQPTAEVRKILPGYLASMRIPVLRGRDVADNDQDVLLVSRGAAKLLWGDENPIGRRITLPLQSRTLHKTVIGIVGDVKQGELADSAQPTVYEFSRDHEFRFLFMTMRTSMPLESSSAAAVAAVRGIDPQQPVEDVRALQARVDETLTSRRFSASLFGLFAALALALAAVGIYSVLSYIVRGRRREIGIRTALGASTRDVLRLFVVEGMKPALTGIVIGAAAALASATLLNRLAFGVSASDPITLMAVAAALGVIALAASFLPAWRASRLPPLKVLREP
jgi:putative ABC transport system permease protein